MYKLNLFKMEKSQIGLIGLGTMGANIARNIANKGFPISVYNRTTATMEKFIEKHRSEKLRGHQELKDFVDSIASPRKIIILVKAGKPVQMVINSLTPLLDKGDIIIDCGNSYFKDTETRYDQLKEQGFHYIGCGVSGGEEGALNGPSMMPGGDLESWNKIKEIFEPASAKDFQGGPCVTYIGDKSAGHYVKMVHNGIEYGVMQMMAEVYEIFRTIYKLSAPEIADIFDKYNQGKLQSYLFEIGTKILRKKDDQGEGYLIDKILDKAAQKGTGKWTGIEALNRGTALPTITEAVFARVLSSQKSKRTEISKLYAKPEPADLPALEDLVETLEDALYAGILSSYAQGYELIKTASEEENWNVDLGEISRIWEGGCIIRAQILKQLHSAFAANPNKHLFQIEDFIDPLQENIPALRAIVSFAAQNALPLASLATALSYFESMTSANLSANYIQGLRDFFGAHTFERNDMEGSFHADWE